MSELIVTNCQHCGRDIPGPVFVPPGSEAFADFCVDAQPHPCPEKEAFDKAFAAWQIANPNAGCFGC